MLKLNLGCGPDTPAGWVNIDKSPSVFLSRMPRVRRTLLKTRVLTPEQAAGFPQGIVFADVSRRIPATTSSVDFVYSSHMIEHLSRWQALAFVKECRRVLRPGGVLRLATPDLAQLVADYKAGSSPLLSDQPTPADAFCAEYGAFSEIEDSPARRLIRRMFSGAIHQWLYDFESLSHLLREGGFTEIDERRYRAGATPDLHEVEFRERSLFVEAR